VDIFNAKLAKANRIIKMIVARRLAIDGSQEKIGCRESKGEIACYFW
jgi:hypothetical protein